MHSCSYLASADNPYPARTFPLPSTVHLDPGRCSPPPTVHTESDPPHAPQRDCPCLVMTSRSRATAHGRSWHRAPDDPGRSMPSPVCALRRTISSQSWPVLLRLVQPVLDSSSRQTTPPHRSPARLRRTAAIQSQSCPILPVLSDGPYLASTPPAFSRRQNDASHASAAHRRNEPGTELPMSFLCDDPSPRSPGLCSSDWSRQSSAALRDVPTLRTPCHVLLDRPSRRVPLLVVPDVPTRSSPPRSRPPRASSSPTCQRAPWPSSPVRPSSPDRRCTVQRDHPGLVNPSLRIADPSSATDQP